MAKWFTYLKDSANELVGATLTETTENASFPAENLIALPVSKPFKSADAALTAQKTLIDLGSAKAIDIFALVNHNLQSGATITIRAGAGPDPSTFSTTITWRTELAWKIFASQNFRYWSLTLDDAGNPDNHLRAGYAMLGTKTQLGFQFQQTWQKDRIKLQRSVLNEVGIPMIGAEIFKGWRLGLSFSGLPATEIATLHTFLDSLDVKSDPVLLVPDTTEADAYFARLENSHVIAQGTGAAQVPELAFITDSFGTVITA